MTTNFVLSTHPLLLLLLLNCWKIRRKKEERERDKSILASKIHQAIYKSQGRTFFRWQRILLLSLDSLQLALVECSHAADVGFV